MAYRGKKVDPADNGVYTFSEIITFYQRDFGHKAIMAYWERVCVPVGTRRSSAPSSVPEHRPRRSSARWQQVKKEERTDSPAGVDAVGADLLSKINGDAGANPLSVAAGMLRYLEANMPKDAHDAYGKAMIDHVLSVLRTGSQPLAQEPDFEEDPGVDKPTADWISRAFTSSFSDAGTKGGNSAGISLRASMRAMQFARKLKSLVAEKEQTPVQKALQRIGSWEGFDIFSFAELTHHKPLQAIGLESLATAGRVADVGVDLGAFATYMERIEDLYKANPYHSSVHAADTTQATLCFFQAARGSSFTESEKLSALLSSLVHDVGHPGVTNDYLVNAGDAEAITYSDRSVNESMHAAIAFRTMQEQGCNFLASLSRAKYAALRKDVIACILNTDMSTHFKNLAQLKAGLETHGDDLEDWDDRLIVLEWLVHTSDISNPARPRLLAEKWTDLVLEEFFAQGDLERTHGYPISPLCDRHTVQRATSQVGFCKYVVIPALSVLDKLFDVTRPIALANEHHDVNAEEAKKAQVAPAGA